MKYWPKVKGSELLAEALGTGGIVFAGTGAVVVNALSGGAITHLGISLIFGAVVMVLIYALGPISGAHFNPAVTLALCYLGKCSQAKVLPFIGAQLGGAVAGSYLVQLCFAPGHRAPTLGATLPLSGNWGQSLALEFLLTFGLMLVICGVALHPGASAGMAGLTVGATVALAACFGGPISGASMNPARSLGPALVSGHWEFHWVYWVAPILGAWAAAVCWQFLYPEPKESQ